MTPFCPGIKLHFILLDRLDNMKVQVCPVVKFGHRKAEEKQASKRDHTTVWLHRWLTIDGWMKKNIWWVRSYSTVHRMHLEFQVNSFETESSTAKRKTKCIHTALHFTNVTLFVLPESSNKRHWSVFSCSMFPMHHLSRSSYIMLYVSSA